MGGWICSWKAGRGGQAGVSAGHCHPLPAPRPAPAATPRKKSPSGDRPCPPPDTRETWLSFHTVIFPDGLFSLPFAAGWVGSYLFNL